MSDNEAIDNTQDFFDEASAKEADRSLQLFRAGSSHFGIFTDEIATTIAWREPTPLPHAPKSVLGVVSVHGRMLTVLEVTILAARESAASDTTRAAQQHIIALRGDEQLALAVEALGETVKIADGDLESRTAGTLVLGILHLEGSEINVLNVKELFPAAIQGRERRRRRF
ncbi:MAG TPA: chemotaxis protein CheW [Pyrinomonadaceae bacterium]|nr:chemotaxis protein CheW [Pyrinomonadaceae bacterium]